MCRKCFCERQLRKGLLRLRRLPFLRLHYRCFWASVSNQCLNGSGFCHSPSGCMVVNQNLLLKPIILVIQHYKLLKERDETLALLARTEFSVGTGIIQRNNSRAFQSSNLSSINSYGTGYAVIQACALISVLQPRSPNTTMSMRFPPMFSVTGKK